MTEHTWHKCTCGSSSCSFCGGGLGACVVCGGAEGSLPTECPGARMSEIDEQSVYRGVLDFRNGRWIYQSRRVLPFRSAG